MTQDSAFWTTGGAGDGTDTYTRSDWSNFLKVLAACLDDEGVAPAYLNALAPSTTGVNNARIATGGALVDGKLYYTDANVDTVIPSAVGGGNTRIDRIVLRADWTAQTVRVTKIAGTDAASPTAPAITQSSGTTYDIKLCQALVNTSGTVTITDERTFARPGAMSLANALAYSFVNAAGTAIKPAVQLNSSNQLVIFSAGQGVRIINDAQDTVLFDITDAGTVTLNTPLTAANIANRTRKEFIPALYGNNDTDGGVLTAGQLGIVMLDAKVCSAFGRWQVPMDYVSGLTIDAVVTHQIAGPRDIYVAANQAYSAKLTEAYTTNNDNGGDGDPEPSNSRKDDHARRP